jgi:hypothetical protein
MSDRVIALVAETTEAARELPMPAIVYFFIAFGIFLLLLGITWTFRNTGKKVPVPHHGAHGTPGSAVEANRPHH